ncbi:MAG TPA: hypothetical protein PKI76_01450 [Oscillospiraceae bacterium]|nr:hypothetical protein [Oscillospiraceae bacterium]HNW04035.1 hypothetical protein [Oscillospiraceae bacterium]
MTTGINLWDKEVWSFVVTLTLLFFAMMTANTLRNMIPALRKLMIPSSVLGGFLILFLGYFYRQITGEPLLRTATLEMLTYHGLGLGFVAMSLRNTEPQKDRTMKTGGFDSGVTVVATYLMQAVLGMAISIACYYSLGSFFASGMLLPLGYGQGPGNAYTWGRTYENSYGFTDGTSFGLTVAAMGFIAASVGGVIYLNILRKKGRFSGEIGSSSESEHVTLGDILGEKEIPMTEAMDKFTVQVALVFLAYSMAYLFLLGVNLLTDSGALGGFGTILKTTLWPFNFLLGTLFALLLKAVLNALKKKGVIHREYTNNFMQNRISGFMFDIMVVASIAAIDLSAFKHQSFVVPLALLCLLGGVTTYFYLDIVCKKVFHLYRDEAFLSLYGMLTGTASTGIILLRETDPRFETQAASNLVYHQPWAILFGFPMLLLLSVAPSSIGKAWLTLGVVTLLFLAMNVISFRNYLFKRQKKTVR